MYVEPFSKPVDLHSYLYTFCSNVSISNTRCEKISHNVCISLPTLWLSRFNKIGVGKIRIAICQGICIGTMIKRVESEQLELANTEGNRFALITAQTSHQDTFLFHPNLAKHEK